jgi:hypothetical protein
MKVLQVVNILIRLRSYTVGDLYSTVKSHEFKVLRAENMNCEFCYFELSSFSPWIYVLCIQLE